LGGALGLAAIVWWRTGRHDEPAPAPAVTAAPAPTAAPPAPPPPAPSPPPAAPTPPAAAPAVATMNEKVLMARLREVAKTDSAAAITLAEEGNRRFPDTADAPERESILIH